ncbi:MAG: Transcriptional activator protein CzcR [Verrucomicrobiae bacterium]|nr:Transcriptional activator protein CzcR [Verrucomicrobiae bacterium]
MSPLFSHDKPCVLAIDDEPDLLDIIKTALDEEGYEVLTASDPNVGLKLYEEHWRKIGVVLLDYMMPAMTGDLVFECLLRQNPYAKVLLLTACDDHVARRMFEQGLRGYIQKPFYLNDLISRVYEEINAA